MSTIESIPDLYRAIPQGSHGYEISLDVQGGVAKVIVAGRFDKSAADALSGILGCTDEMDCPIHLRADDVTHVDLAGLEPVLRTARLRAARDLPPVVIDSASGAVWQLLRTLTIGSELPEGLIP
jgi:hypothetical protein